MSDQYTTGNPIQENYVSCLSSGNFSALKNTITFNEVDKGMRLKCFIILYPIVEHTKYIKKDVLFQHIIQIVLTGPK